MQGTLSPWPRFSDLASYKVFQLVLLPPAPPLLRSEMETPSKACPSESNLGEKKKKKVLLTGTSFTSFSNVLCECTSPELHPLGSRLGPSTPRPLKKRNALRSISCPSMPLTLLPQGQTNSAKYHRPFPQTGLTLRAAMKKGSNSKPHWHSPPGLKPPPQSPK